ncbi:MAG: type 1 glutamine amidotransferase domain-containing protein [bacterium]|nr:type 1 glutamine amidotransferase domain-containing protein [bacterium]
MTHHLSDKKVAFLTTDQYEDSELTSPWEAVEEAGATAHLLSPGGKKVEGKKGHSQEADLDVADANASDYDMLVLPGGTKNADHLRVEEAAVKFVKDFNAAGKPIAVICHGPWILTDADAVSGKKMTSYKSLKTDLKNAGAEWVDEEVVVDANLITSRTPDDLPAFNRELLKALEG